ncbi:MAG: TolC family protein [Muribaculaceae bacterium]|nr:TolC family protein [Muribaculaceae bacterium]
MKNFLALLILHAICVTLHAGEPDSLTLTLDDAIRLARQNSPSAQSARNSFLSAYWNYRYYRANYLPSVTLTSSPYINKEMNKITQSDGTAMFIRQDQFGADLTLKINQNISLTGGSFFLKSSLNRLDEFQHGTTAYSSQPLVIGYQQSLFGYNSLKWDRKIEPIRYREAKKQYAETLELISATTCNHFFSLASAGNELEMARQNFASADTLYRMAQGRYEIGTITENEMLQLEINRLNEETNVMDAEINLREAEQSLRSFLALEDNVKISLTVPDSVPDFDIPAAQALELALTNSPDPEYYNRMIKQSESNLAYAKANARMKADLYVQFGLSQTGKDISQSLSHLMHQEYASVTLSVPILDWGRGRGKVKEAKSQLALARTTADQGMNDFRQNVEKLVMQFNMQARKVSIASLTSLRSTQRHSVAMKLFMMGRIGILDLMSAVSEKNVAKRNFIAAMRTYWSLYFTLRSMTAYDFQQGKPLMDDEALLSK